MNKNQNIYWVQPSGNSVLVTEFVDFISAFDTRAVWIRTIRDQRERLAFMDELEIVQL